MARGTRRGPRRARRTWQTIRSSGRRYRVAPRSLEGRYADGLGRVSLVFCMRAVFHHLRDEFRPMLSLAWPVVVAELGWVLMGIVDTIMVGRVSPQAIGAVGLGSSIYVAFAIFGMGLLLGLDTLVSRAFGADRLDECHRWLLQGLYLAAIASLPVMLVSWQ